MTPFELLSKVVLETLRRFSVEKRPLNAESLCSALGTNKELAYLFSEPEPAGSTDLKGSRHPFSKGKPARVSLKPAESVQNGNSSANSHFSELQDIVLKIVGELGKVSKEGNANYSTELQRRIQACNSIEDLAACGEDIVGAIQNLISRAVDQVNYTGEFLAELSKDLSRMEKELFSYQNQNRETFLLHDQFCDNLLSQTEEINEAVDSQKGLENTRNLISSKLTTIGKAIVTKRKEDEGRLKDADTKIAELQMSVRGYNEEIVQVTERANALEKEVLLDGLTEIHNRRAYDLEIIECLRQYHRDAGRFSLILIDVDRFKSINDNYGHRAGDKFLRELAKIIESSLRKTDFLARYGGEEIIAILPGSSSQDSQKVAEKIRSRVESTRFTYLNEHIPVTISLGVTEVMPEDKDPEAPFIRVDEAMYRAKKQGRNRVCVSS
jgi:diguanylate cyclase